MIEPCLRAALRWFPRHLVSAIPQARAGAAVEQLSVQLPPARPPGRGAARSSRAPAYSGRSPKGSLDLAGGHSRSVVRQRLTNPAACPAGLRHSPTSGAVAVTSW
jgi:hypothetical protein